MKKKSFSELREDYNRLLRFLNTYNIGKTELYNQFLISDFIRTATGACKAYKGNYFLVAYGKQARFVCQGVLNYQLKSGIEYRAILLVSPALLWARDE